MKGSLIIIILGAIVAGVLIVAGVDYLVLGKPSPAESPPVEQPAAPSEAKPSAEQLVAPEKSKPVTTSEEAPVNFEKELEKLSEAIADVCASGKAKEVALVFTEVEANDQAARLLLQTEIPEDIPLEIKNVYIDFQTGNNVLTKIEAVAFGFGATIKVKSQVGIKDGKPEVEVTDVSFGFVPLPESLKERITGLVKQEIEGLLGQLTETELGCNGKLALVFTDIKTQEEEATITIRIEPKQ